MAVERVPRLTPGEYLEKERRAERRSEYLAGQVYAMAGASPSHVTITVNIAAELRAQLKGHPCGTFATDLRVRTDSEGLYTYPDVVIVCGEPQFADDQRDTLTNPTLIVKVLSESTEAFDRGAKFQHYRDIASLREYVLVSQQQSIVEHFVRQESGEWLYSSVSGLDTAIRLPSIGCSLALSEVYDRVDFISNAGEI